MRAHWLLNEACRLLSLKASGEARGNHQGAAPILPRPASARGAGQGTVELTRPVSGGGSQLVQAGQYMMATDSGQILSLPYQPLQFTLVPLKEPARCQ